MAMYTLAHLSDPHLANWPLPGPGSLLSKRVVGLLSWQFRRRRIHRTAVLDLLTADLARSGADHIAVTGDITNISLPAEFANAARWLERLGPPERVSVVPGNHDSYVAVPWSEHMALWTPYMAGDADDNPATGAALFPYLRHRGPLAIVGVSTAAPMPFNSSGGYLGDAQLARLEPMLADLGRKGAFRVILIHHPPQPHATQRRKALFDAAAFRRVVARAGAELILHGHTHRAHLDKISGPAGTVPVLGVPSASALPHHGKHPAAYHLYRIAADGAGWSIAIETRGLAAACDHIETTGRFRLELPRAGATTATLMP
jgi:3',5'-cyclic AMP phosphodiesterase CpdA